ncbi:MAG TPA: BldC family transcriptional regulator [Candidatus Saccharimonadales bacterium]|nr:BldC family transcriptional regulator [Candidatus Saccharimonadales bacterium]
MPRELIDPDDQLLTSGEVAALFRVDPKTVPRWVKAGRLSSKRTPGGHHRFRVGDIRALMAGVADDEGETDISGNDARQDEQGEDVSS